MSQTTQPGSGQSEVKAEQGGKNDHPEAARFSEGPSALRRAVEAHEQEMRIGEFLKRSVAVLSSLAVKENGAVADCLAAFRKSVLEGSALDQMEIDLDRLKKAMGGTGEEQKTDSGGSLWDKFRRRANRQKAPSQGLPNELRSIFLGIISEFDHDMGEEYSEQISRLRKEIEGSTELDDLMALRDDLLGIIQAHARIINEERNQITDFISEIGSGLMEVERQYVNSMNQTGQGQTDNSKFNEMLDNQIEDMKKSAQLSSTLAEFKSLVMSRLASIRAALEAKRKAEALRQENLNEEMQDLQQNLNRMKKEIEQVHEKRKALEKEILIDQLTGVANKRALRSRLKDELQRFTRYKHFFSMLLFDIDNFKEINDKYGHWAGDKCLKEIIKRIKPILRDTDVLARWGGDEFVVLFPGTELESAVAVAERIRKSIENIRFIYQRQEICMTVSIGVTEVNPADQTQEMIFNRVDKAMYKAKKKGRNVVVPA